MPSVEESEQAKGPLATALQLGLDMLALKQEVVFTKYVRVVLPVDGFVFLVRADLLTPPALAQACLGNQFAVDAPLRFVQVGSLHHATDLTQEQEKTFSSNQVIFTSEDEIAHLNLAVPSVYYMGEIDGAQWCFSARNSFYRQAGLWHYVGATRWSEFASVIIDDPGQLDLENRVVSNSLPIWLSLVGYAPAVSLVRNPGVPLYPSYLTPRNLPPPYGVVHVEPRGTAGLAQAPMFSQRGSYPSAQAWRSQLCVDQVEVTLYGVRSDQAMDFVDWVEQFCAFNPTAMGIMNVPVVQDEKAGQVELQAIAMKKRVRFDVNYYQFRANEIARQLIKQAFVTVLAEA